MEIPPGTAATVKMSFTSTNLQNPSEGPTFAARILSVIYEGYGNEKEVMIGKLTETTFLPPMSNVLTCPAHSMN